MQCVKCGATLPVGAEICAACGARVAAASAAPLSADPVSGGLRPDNEPGPAIAEPIRSVEKGERPPPHVGKKLNVLGYFASVVIWLPVAFGLLFVYGFFNHAALVPRLEAGFEEHCIQGGVEQGLKGSVAGIKRYCDCAWDQARPRIGRMDTAISQISFGIVNPTPPQQRIDACVEQLD